MEIDQSPYIDAAGHSRRSRRRRRSGLGGLEIFVGLSALWMFLVVGVVMLEALSAQHWFFVDHQQADPILGQGNWVVGDQVMLEDGTLVPMNASQPQSIESSTASNDADAETTLRWGRVIVVLLSVPMLYVAYRAAQRVRRSLGAARP